MAHRASRMRPAADFHHRGIAVDDVHALVGNVKQIGHHLGEARLVALPVRLRADHGIDAGRPGRILRPHLELRLLLRRSDRRLDIIGEPPAKQLAAALGFAAPRRKSLPVGDFHRPVHVLFVMPAVVEHSDRVAIGHRLRRYEVLTTQRDAVDAELFGRLVDQALDGEGDFRPARAAVCIGRHGVGEHRDRTQRGRRNRIGAGNKARALAQRRQRHAARADVTDIGRAHADEAVLVVDRELHRRHQIAALIIAEKGFGAHRGEFDRPAELLCRPQHKTELDIGAVTRAKIAADIGGNHPQPLRWHADHVDQFVPLPHCAARTGIEQVGVRRGIVLPKRRTRLHRHAGDAADVEFLRHNVRRAGKSPVGRFAIAKKSLDQHVVRDLIPDRGRARLHCAFRMQNERHLFVLNLDGLGRIHCLRLGFGDHHHHGFADMPHLVGRQKHVGTGEHCLTAGPMQLHVVFGLRHRVVRDRTDLVGRTIGAGEDAKNARHRLGALGDDRRDARVRVGRPHYRGIGLALNREVISEPAMAGDEARVFLAWQRFADKAEAGFIRFS